MATRKSRTAAPKQLTIRAYQAGFGDCFLLTWQYAKAKRHVLIDFGSNGQPKSAPKNLLGAIAQDIAKQCEGKLDAVVLTHRHKDHIAGFTTNAKGNGPGDVIRALKPDVIVQPWTEHPRAATNATTAPSTFTGAQSFAASLDHMQTISAGVVAEAGRLQGADSGTGRALFQALTVLGEEGILNHAAVENLRTMGKRHAYVSHGTKSGLDAILPGVKITVLGPPTVKQSAEVKKERSTDAAEFWMLRANAGQLATAGGKALFPRARRLSATKPRPYARWLVPRLRAIRGDALLGIVRMMDDAMNNTSVILLFEVGGKKFLFPGDAQIENWAYTLKQPKLMKQLADVSFYKVGHHGSRNATPKTLWAAFTAKGPASKKNRLTTVVSTMASKYGKVGEGSEVPRQTLVAALEKESDFFTTQSLRGKTLYRDFAFSLGE